MPDVRPLNEDKYKISKRKFLEVYLFCLQYYECLYELEKGVTTKGTGNMDGMPKGKGETSSSTEAIAIRRAELRRKCELVEQRVPDGKYFSGCKCGICLPMADKLCAQQTAKSLAEKAEGLFRQAHSLWKITKVDRKSVV